MLSNHYYKAALPKVLRDSLERALLSLLHDPFFRIGSQEAGNPHDLNLKLQGYSCFLFNVLYLLIQTSAFVKIIIQLYMKAVHPIIAGCISFLNVCTLLNFESVFSFDTVVLRSRILEAFRVATLLFCRIQYACPARRKVVNSVLTAMLCRL